MSIFKIYLTLDNHLSLQYQMQYENIIAILNSLVNLNVCIFLFIYSEKEFEKKNLVILTFMINL